jgi:hypothetical protein
MEAADERIEAIIAHHANPDGEAGDTAKHHCQTRTEHGEWIAPKSSLCVRIEDGKEAVSVIQIGLLQLLQDTVVPMVGTQAAVAARIGKRGADIALVRGEWRYHE